MANQLHNTGEEYIVDKLDGETHDVGLYNDGADGLTDADNIGAITTEPGGSYARQSASITTAKNASGNYEIQVGDVVFDTSSADQSVDSGFVVVNFSSDEAGTTGDHLLFTFPIEDSNGSQTTLDLTNFNELTLSGQSLSLD